MGRLPESKGARGGEVVSLGEVCHPRSGPQAGSVPHAFVTMAVLAGSDSQSFAWRYATFLIARWCITNHSNPNYMASRGPRGDKTGREILMHKWSCKLLKTVCFECACWKRSWRETAASTWKTDHRTHHRRLFYEKAEEFSRTKNTSTRWLPLGDVVAFQP